MRAFDPVVTTLRLGLEAIDAQSQMPVARLLRVEVEDPTQAPFPAGIGGDPLWFQADSDFAAIPRHPSGRLAIGVPQGTRPYKRDRVVRFYDRTRRYVPRRIEFDVTTLAAANLLWFRPWMYPGATAPIGGLATGVRGTVLTAATNGARVPWTRVRATLPDGTQVWAQGDDRGEFLLILPPFVFSAAELTPTVEVALIIYGLSVPRDATRVARDPLYDVPVEVLPTGADAASAQDRDDMLAGRALPEQYPQTSAWKQQHYPTTLAPTADYAQLVQQTVSLNIGEIASIQFPPPTP